MAVISNESTKHETRLKAPEAERNMEESWICRRLWKVRISETYGGAETDSQSIRQLDTKHDAHHVSKASKIMLETLVGNNSG